VFYADCKAWDWPDPDEIRRGRRVKINGRLSVSEWIDKETGKKRVKSYVTAEVISFVAGTPERPFAAKSAPDTVEPEPQDFGELDKIPF
jgi:single-stranded DNA-binding protein